MATTQTAILRIIENNIKEMERNAEEMSGILNNLRGCIEDDSEMAQLIISQLQEKFSYATDIYQRFVGVTRTIFERTLSIEVKQHVWLLNSRGEQVQDKIDGIWDEFGEMTGIPIGSKI
ncbi:uncharacterized protein ASCRUDRAFT_74957 [Ascoidea rubescens DSM 1968]|uniref:Uncharacterized protein n=1 Tax=Ascoidea rubescens DSM 1968 TaxID=1344418 RepID=A0A1D2VLY1_9ASCO|nr:hypothetical protein ASCRUDRAFT_74957 [Ascoidea rubescens DSM 1968]ODV62609.1 hypothetical protein ASCRUDRAFT_74957 [Ascoidea rubescens DSM 1968]